MKNFLLLILFSMQTVCMNTHVAAQEAYGTIFNDPSTMPLISGVEILPLDMLRNSPNRHVTTSDSLQFPPGGLAFPAGVLTPQTAISFDYLIEIVDCGSKCCGSLFWTQEPNISTLYDRPIDDSMIEDIAALNYPVLEQHQLIHLINFNDFNPEKPFVLYLAIDAGPNQVKLGYVNLSVKTID